MSVWEIRIFGDPVLREKCRAVESIDGEIRTLIDDLTDTMYAAEGVGLAAPQVGVPLRVFVYDVREPEARAGALVNPRIVERSGTAKETEGCLSIPGLSEIVGRDARVVVEGLDRDGREVQIDAEGLLSRCLQHEIDHLDGILFIDHLSPLKRKMLLSKWAKMDESEKVPVHAL
ncbi:MAG: peptide deformylase [Gemmatimonadota bacterium]